MSSDVLPVSPVSEDWFSWVERRREQPSVIDVRRLGVRFTSSPGGGGLHSLARRVIQREESREVWALRDVDLTVRAGECLGIIGRNGAGKSTLLRVMGRLIEHDTGSVRVRGRISALLNLGVGFDPLLTGRQNIQLVGSLMGLNRNQTHDRMDEVIEFADIGAAINAPLRTYSSGMRARLGFATAATMIEPHVLLLDEVMGTGDAAFRDRSRERVMDLVQHAHAVVVTSHDMAWVSEFASYAVLLDDGRVVAEGSPPGVTTLHRARSVKPPRRFGCDRCGGQETESYCSVCGVWRKN